MPRYFTISRSHTYSLLFALPLLLLYEGGAVYVARAEGSTLRNGADVLLRTLLALGGLHGTAALTVAVIIAASVLVFQERRRRNVPIRVAPFLGMAAESLLYAWMLGIVLGTATQWLLRGLSVPLAAGAFGSVTFAEGIVLSLGAGVYEELLFRVLLTGGLFGIFRSSGVSSGQAGLFAVILSAIVFSGFHYVGPYGDAFALPSFLFRFLAGVVFSVLFLVRGFGITAWTHALYDLIVLLAING